MGSREELEAEAFKLFTGIGLEETTSKNALKNPKFRQSLVDVIKEAGAADGCAKTQGNCLYTVASKFPANALVHRPLLLKYVMNGDIKSNNQLDGAFEYLKKVGAGDVAAADLEQSAGVGVVITPEQIQEAVQAAIKSQEARLKEERYHMNLNILLGQATKALKWADGAAVRAVLEQQVEALLGPKTEADLKPPEKKKKSKPADGPAAEAKPKAAPQPKADEPPPPPEDPFAFFTKPEQNNMVHTTVNFSDGKVMRIANSNEQLATHLKVTGGKVVTRFPPEPNGYLHIGHAKAMFIDFGMAKQYDGVCYLRYDDTNPEAEKQEYIDHIAEIVSWLGWTPWKTTYSSDYFQQLYEFAVQMIKTGHAFVCHQTKEEIEKSREERSPSPWRDRPVEENLRLFEDMRRGLYPEGGATLRMKMDVKNDNYNMFDLIAYRIKYVEHPHGGDTWCIYPSYDYTHCLVDALENITHSLCTLEFESRRASYYWLLDVLGTYKPLVWEYSRLNITHNVMSKRKLNKLVMGGYVDGWDDPRLLTLAGLRRRGVSPSAINNFCREVGVTRNETTLHMHRLEHYIRLDLDQNSPRTLAVLRPLKVVITNFPEGKVEQVEAQVFPGREGGTYPVPFSRVVYIEDTDFRLQDSKDYYGFAPGKSVMLRYAYPITYTSHTTDASGRVTEIQATYDPDFRSKKPPKGVLNWVSEPAPGQAPAAFTARLYEHLFKSEEPGGLEEWLEDLNPESCLTLTGCLACPKLAEAKAGDKFQLERLGYFVVDPCSTPGSLVLNRTVTLKESFPKQAPAKK